MPMSPPVAATMATAAMTETTAAATTGTMTAEMKAAEAAAGVVDRGMRRAAVRGSSPVVAGSGGAGGVEVAASR